MITSFLQGGLGNQLFQISAVISLALENDDDAVFDIKNHDLPKQGRKCENYLKNIFRNLNFSDNLFIKNQYREPFYHYKKIEYKSNMCLIGYFQSEKYFSKHANVIREVFSIDEYSLRIIKQKYEEILKKEPISIHVRRGDYIKYEDFHPPCSLEYYNKAMKQFPENSTFLVFSDDIEWCKQNFVGENFWFVDGNEDYIDLYLMFLCKSAIIANSSFSWWGAWLGKADKVIAPNKWFGKTGNNTKDLFPTHWTLL
jgi:hypothetical protein